MSGTDSFIGLELFCPGHCPPPYFIELNAVHLNYTKNVCIFFIRDIGISQTDSLFSHCISLGSDSSQLRWHSWGVEQSVLEEGVQTPHL